MTEGKMSRNKSPSVSIVLVEYSPVDSKSNFFVTTGVQISDVTARDRARRQKAQRPALKSYTVDKSRLYLPDGLSATLTVSLLMTCYNGSCLEVQRYPNKMRVVILIEAYSWGEYKIYGKCDKYLTKQRKICIHHTAMKFNINNAIIIPFSHKR